MSYPLDSYLCDPDLPGLEQRIPLTVALVYADHIAELIGPHVERVEVAGSIRRGRPDVKDIELVVQRKETSGMDGLFADDADDGDPLLSWARSQKAVQWVKTGTSTFEPTPPRAGARYMRGVLWGRRPDMCASTIGSRCPDCVGSGVVRVALAAGGLKKAHGADGVTESTCARCNGWRYLLARKLDIFIATRSNWGMVMAIRTGPADFSKALVTYARRVGYEAAEGGLRRVRLDGPPQKEDWVNAPDEATVFRTLNIEWVDPGRRAGWDSIRPLP
jgi:hypothetical protein